MENIRITINSEDLGMRLDRFLKEKQNMPFSLVQKLIRKKDIKINDSSTRHNYHLQAKDIISIKGHLPDNNTIKKQPEDQLYFGLLDTILKEIIFQDGYIIAINKPYDIAVQGGSKILISINDILKDLKYSFQEAPRLVHRIDRHTSGILLLARTKEIAQILTQLFREQKIQKKYIALVRGIPDRKSGTLKMIIQKTIVEDQEKMSESLDGKESITKFKVIKNVSKDIALVEFEPITGRTHQIRIHAAELLNCPILGDKKYGGENSIIKGLTHKTKLHLASQEVKIDDVKGRRYNITCPMPTHMLKTIEELEKSGIA